MRKLRLSALKLLVQLRGATLCFEHEHTQTMPYAWGGFDAGIHVEDLGLPSEHSRDFPVVPTATEDLIGSKEML